MLLLGGFPGRGAVQMLLDGIFRRPFSSHKFGNVFKILNKRDQGSLVFREEVPKENKQQLGGLGISK